MRYCNHEDVGALLQVYFTATSKPTDTKVMDIVSMLSSEVNLTLRSVGTATASQLIRVLAMVNGYFE